MTAIWPTSLPQCFLRGVEEAPRMAKASFQADTGPDIERPKGTIKLAELSVSVRLDRDQAATFEDFVFTDLEQATLSFFITHPRKLEQVKVRLVGGDRPYQLSQVAPARWIASFNLLVIG